MPSSLTPTWAPELLARAYYSDDSIVLVHGDCLELADLWTCADVLVTDPPYGIAYSTHNPRSRRDSLAGDTSPGIRDAALSAWGGRPACVFGSWRVARPEGTRAVLIWDKTDGTGPGQGDHASAFGNSHEEIYILGRWPRTTKRRGSVFRTADGIRALAGRLAHPTPKPVSLMSAIIAAAPPGTIADPFAGSGSTLVAAKALGRKAIGVELDERYCEIAARRLSLDVLDFGEPT